MLVEILWLCCAVSSLAEAVSSPLSIPPSQYWDGNDGSWSTFHVQVGTPGQTVRLLPGTSATAGSTTWVVIPQGCTDANPGLTGCAEDRGAVFASNLSTTWSTQGLSNGGLYELTTYEESMLGLSGNALYGFDNIALGLPGSGSPSIGHQVIAGFAENDFWLGSLGLSPTPHNFSTLNDPQPSLLGTLRDQDLIPSTSWAYTAGARYNEPPVFGSLTFGGYDRTRFAQQSENITVAFGSDISRDLLLPLGSITYDTVGSSPLMASSIDIFINSLITDLWLPVSVCQAFEQQFDLTWDSSSQLYLLDEDTHDALVAQNPAFTFTLGDSSTGTVDIVLPYSAFDQMVSEPLVNSSSRYFPLKRAQNDTQYTLGRVFLQEAYVLADYDRREFSIAQAALPSTEVESDIVAIYPPGYDTGNSTTGSNSPNADDGGISGGVIGGIVVAIVAVVLVALGIWWFMRRRNKKSQQRHELDGRPVGGAAEKRVEDRSHHNYHEVEGAQISELDHLPTAKTELHAYEMNRMSEMDGKTHYRHNNIGELESPGFNNHVRELGSPGVNSRHIGELESLGVTVAELDGSDARMSRPGANGT